jgi:hypothetical protein
MHAGGNVGAKTDKYESTLYTAPCERPALTIRRRSTGRSVALAAWPCLARSTTPLALPTCACVETIIGRMQILPPVKFSGQGFSLESVTLMRCTCTGLTNHQPLRSPALLALQQQPYTCTAVSGNTILRRNCRVVRVAVSCRNVSPLAALRQPQDHHTARC